MLAVLMDTKTDILFTPARLGKVTLPNRFVRSATYEGMADEAGLPNVGSYAALYGRLAGGGVGTVITGFCFVDYVGRAMQRRQGAIDRDACIEPWLKITDSVRRANSETKIFMQLVHCGRQTLAKVTGGAVKGAGTKRCSYFRQRTEVMTESDIRRVVDRFVAAARRAQAAGFDGVQIHAAHGYLIHQFLSPYTNTRQDKWADRNLLLLEIVKAVRGVCGEKFPILVKLSSGDDRGLTVAHTLETCRAIEHCVEAAEISYGTMEYALNIFRGGCPTDTILQVNPLFNGIPGPLRYLWKKLFLKKYQRRFIGFSENYNLEAVRTIASQCRLPLIPVGGIRTPAAMAEIVSGGAAAVSLCRPLICQPDLPNLIRQGQMAKSKCTNCNLCAVYCDSDNELRCYCDNKR